MKILCLDFDGVIHSFTSGWRGAGIIPDPPVPGALDFIKDATGEFVLGFALLVVFAVICIALALSLPRRPGPEPIEEGLTPA